MRYRILVVGLLLIPILACNMPAARPAETPTVTVTAPAPETALPTQVPATPTVSPSPTQAAEATAGAPEPTLSTKEPPRHGALLYETNFAQGWPPLTGDKANGKMVNGGYQIDITQPWALYAFTTRARQSTFYAEVTAEPSQCPSGDGGYGLIFHYQNDTSFRFITVWCSGRYSLQERTGPSSASTLSEGNLAEEIDPATGEHTVSVRAFANKLTVYFDDKQIAQADVTSLTSGDVGPYAETTGDAMSVLFSRLAVYAAE